MQQNNIVWLTIYMKALKYAWSIYLRLQRFRKKEYDSLSLFYFQYLLNFDMLSNISKIFLLPTSYFLLPAFYFLFLHYFPSSYFFNIMIASAWNA